MYLIIAIILFAFLWYLVVSPKAHTYTPRYSEADKVNSFSTTKSAYQREQYQEYRYYLVPYRCDGEIGPFLFVLKKYLTVGVKGCNREDPRGSIPRTSRVVNC